MSKLVLNTENDKRLGAVLWDARERFEKWADINAPKLPEDAVDAMQVRLYRWQGHHFGIQPDNNITLGIGEEVGETAEATDPDEMMDGLGDVMVYIGQSATGNRLAIQPVLRLATEMFNELLDADDDFEPPTAIVLLGQLNHTVLKHVQNIRGMGDDDAYRRALVWRWAQLLSRVLFDIFHNAGVDIDARSSSLLERTYIDVGNTVMARRGEMLPAVPAQQ